MVVHCSDSPQGRGDNAQTIHAWHKARGWDGIGYHYVILEDGTVENGRPEYWTGSHAKGFNDAIGVCLVGKDSFTKEQFASLEKLIKARSLKSFEVVGHYIVNHDKTCPNFNVENFLIRIGV